MTPEQLRRALADTAKQRADLKEADETLEAQEIQLRAMLVEATRRLKHGPVSSRLGGRMLSETATREERLHAIAADPARAKADKIAASNVRNASEAKVLLLELRVKDGEVAKLVGVNRSTVQAWHAGRNPIPRAQAQKILAQWAVPLSAWPKLAD